MAQIGRYHLVAATCTLVLVFTRDATSGFPGICRLVAACFVTMYLVWVLNSLLRREPKLAPDLWDDEVDRRELATQRPLPKAVPSRRPCIRVSEAEGVTIVRFQSLEKAVCREELIHLIAEDLFALVGPLSIVLDFEGLDFIPFASFEAKLMSLHRRSEKAGGKLKMCGVPGKVMEQFRSNSLAQVFHIYGTLEDAL